MYVCAFKMMGEVVQFDVISFPSQRANCVDWSHIALFFIRWNFFLLSLFEHIKYWLWPFIKIIVSQSLCDHNDLETLLKFIASRKCGCDACTMWLMPTRRNTMNEKKNLKIYYFQNDGSWIQKLIMCCQHINIASIPWKFFDKTNVKSKVKPINHPQWIIMWLMYWK